MGDLSKQRNKPNRPFTICGKDFVGPFSIKLSLHQNSPINKDAFVFSYVLLSRQYISNLSTEDFLNALKR